MIVIAMSVLLLPNGWCAQAQASGFGVFTQGASGMGQANAVVAHGAGPSSLYFNPALLNDVPGRQVEIGTTAILAQREFTSDFSGKTFESDDDWNFPSTFYYTQQSSQRLTAGIGVYFPFGLSSAWDRTYEGRYLATSGDIFTLNINPAVSFRVTDRLSLAFGYDLLYLKAELNSMINQFAAGFAVPPVLGGPVIDPTLPDIQQRFEGDGWGSGYNLGVLFKASDRISLGAAYRSHIDIEVEGDASFAAVDPRLAPLFPAGRGEADIRLPQQLAAGVALQITPAWVLEAGMRWEDWDSTRELRINLDAPVLGQNVQVIPRNWQSTWTYLLGGEYAVKETLTLMAGYLYGEGAVPASTFEPLIPDTDAHLFTLGAKLRVREWTISGALGYEAHENGRKNNSLGDPLTGDPEFTANGAYRSDIYLGGPAR
jgi:long-chain fatty acid transport protein